MKDVITPEKIRKYLDITRLALEKAAIIAPGSSHIAEVASDIFDMANRYYMDANHFYKIDDYVNAFAAINYATLTGGLPREHALAYSTLARTIATHQGFRKALQMNSGEWVVEENSRGLYQESSV